MSDDHDQRLVRLYKKGDQDALATLIRIHTDSVFNFICSFVKDTDVAADITQETFVRAWGNINRFDESRSFKVWLLSIAKNAAIDFLRKKKSIPFSKLETEQEDSLPFDVSDDNPLPDELFAQKELREIMNNIVTKLPPMYRSVITLYYHEGLNFREIAAIDGSSIDTIKSRHRRALVIIKKEIMMA